MSPERWSKAVELFHAICDKSGGERAALLDSVSNDDPSLRLVVEQMLRDHESCGSFLNDSPLESFAQSMSPRAAIATGLKFGRYEVRAPIGRGGMGEVWLAHDADLERPVALKFLADERVFGRAVDRLRSEARTVSALNHPNIVTVHEVISHDEVPIIVMELVDGNSLRELCGTPQPVIDVIHIGLQIARALAAAHKHGIIHRDIKPENILVRRDGYIKVVDFGLARPFATGSPPSSSGQWPGATLPVGTPRYMSPEQARGESLSPASDVFSFGLVLYEIAAGQHAFRRDSQQEATRAILVDDVVAPSSVNPLVPASLDLLILSMLAKNPEARPSANEVATKLTESLAPSKPDILPGTPGTKQRHKYAHVGGLVLASALVVTCIVWAIIWVLFGTGDSPQFANLKIQPLTSQAGWEGSPAFSPDGKSIAFDWSEKLDTPPQIYIKQLNDSEPIKLTDSHADGIVGPPVWSPDGKWVAFKREYKVSSSAIFVMPSSGGKEKKILDLTNQYLSARIDWSPDGVQLAFSENVSQAERLAIYLLNLRTGEKRKLTSPPPEDNLGDWNPKFSPDGRLIAFKRVSGFWADDMYIVPVAGGEPRRITWDRRGIWGHAWTADSKSLIVSCQRGTTIFGLWRFPLAAQSRAERIIQGGVDAITPATCWKTKQLAWVNLTQDMNIYRISTAGREPPVKLIASTLRDQDPAYSPDGQIAFVSDRSGSREIWLSRADGTGQKRVTNFNGPDVGHLQWSPDGRRLAFYGRAQGRSDIFALDCDPTSMRCENPKRIISGIKAEVPSWSADGEFLYFASDRTGRWEVWKQAVPGGQRTQITQNGGYASRESPDGKWLYFSKDRSDNIWRIPVQSAIGPSPREELVIGPPSAVQQRSWTVTPDEIVFTERAGKGQPGALRAYQFSSKRIRTILPLMEGFEEGRDYGVSVSSDSRWILYSQLDRSGSNIMLADRVR